jgi:hypothetical protein
MASGAYYAFKESLMDRSIHSGVDLDTDTLAMLLVTADQDGNLGTHQDRADITQECPTSGNYAAGGQNRDGVTVGQSGGTVTLDATDETWTNLTQADIDGAVVYKSSGSAATDLLIVYLDFGNQAVTAADLIVQFNASGILTLA